MKNHALLRYLLLSVGITIALWLVMIGSVLGGFAWGAYATGDARAISAFQLAQAAQVAAPLLTEDGSVIAPTSKL